MKMNGRKAYQQALRMLKEKNIEGSEKAAELLIRKAMNWDQTRFLLSLTEREENVEWDFLLPLLERRIGGEPLQYILGEASFYGYSFLVTKDVLIPRPETELLVEKALKEGDRRGWGKEKLRILDLGTGSGAILLTLLKERSLWEGWGVDRSPSALDVSIRNAERLGVADRYHAVEGDMRDVLSLPLPSPFSVLLSNPPYVPTMEISSLQKEVKEHEPLLALDGGEDGLAFYRAIMRAIPELLSGEGIVLLEVGIGQGEEVSGLLKETAGIRRVELVKDFQEIDRIVVGYL